MQGYSLSPILDWPSVSVPASLAHDFRKACVESGVFPAWMLEKVLEDALDSRVPILITTGCCQYEHDIEAFRLSHDLYGRLVALATMLCVGVEDFVCHHLAETVKAMTGSTASPPRATQPGIDF